MEPIRLDPGRGADLRRLLDGLCDPPEGTLAVPPPISGRPDLWRAPRRGRCWAGVRPAGVGGAEGRP